MRKGVIIHEAVNTAHRGWLSTKVKKVAKSVDTSVSPMNTLKNTNFNIAIILGILFHLYFDYTPGSRRLESFRI